MVIVSFLLPCVTGRAQQIIQMRCIEEDLSEAALVFVVGQVAGTKVGLFVANHRRARVKALQWAMSSLLLALPVVFTVWSTLGEAVR